MRHRSVADWLAWQQAAHPLPVDLGLERVGAVWRQLGMPRARTVLTIGGTNGKGSVAAGLDAILCAAGYETGLFTSPHLIRYNERIRVRGQDVADESLLEAFERVESARGGISLSFFEWNTLAAFAIFARERVDIAILEVGLGGRLDAVNLPDADVAAVVSVGLDHREWLGETLEQIGREKAGIFRSQRPAIYGSRRMPESIERVASERGAILRRLGVDFDFVERVDGWDFVGLGSRRRELPLPSLAGVAQLPNASCTLAVLEAAEPGLLVPDEAVRAGLASIRLAGRFQVIARRPEWILDVAHNADAASTLAANLAARPSEGNTVAVCGILGDKDIGAIARTLAGQFGRWYVAGLDGPRALPAEELAARIARNTRARVIATPDVATGCARAAEICEPGDRIVVFGSFLTVGPALAWLGLAA